MDKCKVFVPMEKDQYEDLISRSIELAIIEKAYKRLKSYDFDSFMKVLFGEETQCAD